VKLATSPACVAVSAVTNDFNGNAVDREAISQRYLSQLRDGGVEWDFLNHAAVTANHESCVVQSASEAARGVGIL
jgi:hypothetical protein